MQATTSTISCILVSIPGFTISSVTPVKPLAPIWKITWNETSDELEKYETSPAFVNFVRLCAGRVGQLANLSHLGADAGVSHTTARHWLTVLEASYIIFQLPPYFTNLRKRLIKTPKLYLYDVGLASYLIGIEHAQSVKHSPHFGELYSKMPSFVEALKHRYNQGRRSNLSFFRDVRGLECDLLYESGNDLSAFEDQVRCYDSIRLF